MCLDHTHSKLSTPALLRSPQSIPICLSFPLCACCWFVVHLALPGGILTDLISLFLCWSCAGNHNCSDFASTIHVMYRRHHLPALLLFSGTHPWALGGGGEQRYPSCHLLLYPAFPLTCLWGVASCFRLPSVPILLSTKPLTGPGQSLPVALTQSLSSQICLFTTYQEPTHNPNILPRVIFDSSSQKPSMAPNCLLNQMKTSIRMISFPPKYLHLHSMHFFPESICWVITLCVVTCCTLWEITRHMSHSLHLWILTTNVERQSMHTSNTSTARKSMSDYVQGSVQNTHHGLLGDMVLVWAREAFGKA